MFSTASAGGAAAAGMSLAWAGTVENLGATGRRLQVAMEIQSLAGCSSLLPAS